MEISLTLQNDDKQIFLPAQILYSNRRSISITVNPGGQIIIRAPKAMPQTTIMSSIIGKSRWILSAYEKQKNTPPPPPDKPKDAATLALEKRYRMAAREYIPKRVAHYQELTGGHYEKICIRDQQTRWGSCSSKGTLSFNYRLMLAPPRVLDYVVVHELCHLTHMNHSKEFWKMVESILPDYRIYRKWLKENGHTLHV